MLPRNEDPDPNRVGWPLPYDVAERRGWPDGYTVRIVRPGWYDLIRLPDRRREVA